jgi:hypothetical protein
MGGCGRPGYFTQVDILRGHKPPYRPDTARTVCVADTSGAAGLHQLPGNPVRTTTAHYALCDAPHHKYPVLRDIYLVVGLGRPKWKGNRVQRHRRCSDVQLDRRKDHVVRSSGDDQDGPHSGRHKHGAGVGGLRRRLNLPQTGGVDLTAGTTEA